MSLRNLRGSKVILYAYPAAMTPGCTTRACGKKVTGVLRSTFVIDEQGVVNKVLYNVKATGHVGRLRQDLGV